MNENKKIDPSYYNYVENIKSPEELGLSSRGTLSQMVKNVDGLVNYADLLLIGNSKASKAGGGPLGNKFFSNTNSVCKDVDNKEDVDRYIYINNIPSGSLPVLSQVGVKSESLRGLIPGVLENANVLNPATIVNSLSGGIKPECKKVKLETINNNNEKNDETHHISIQDLNNMNPCDFINKDGYYPHPISGKKCKSGFIVERKEGIRKSNLNKKENNNIFKSEFDNAAPFFHYDKIILDETIRKKSKLPDDTISQIFLLSISCVGIYMGYSYFIKK